MLLRLLASRRRCPRGAYPPRAFSICHFCPPLRDGEGMRRTQCNASPAHGEKEEEDADRRTDGRTDGAERGRREASYCGIIVVTHNAEEERRTPLTRSFTSSSGSSQSEARSRRANTYLIFCSGKRQRGDTNFRATCGRPEQLVLLVNSSAVLSNEVRLQPACRSITASSRPRLIRTVIHS